MLPDTPEKPEDSEYLHECGCWFGHMTTPRLRGRKWMRILAQIRREQPLCLECKAIGKVKRWDQVDHIIPLEHGGTNERTNLVGLCTPHHEAKTARERGYRSAGACDRHGNPLDPSHHWHR